MLRHNSPLGYTSPFPGQVSSSEGGTAPSGDVSLQVKVRAACTCVHAMLRLLCVERYGENPIQQAQVNGDQQMVDLRGGKTQALGSQRLLFI